MSQDMGDSSVSGHHCSSPRARCSTPLELWGATMRSTDHAPLPDWGSLRTMIGPASFVPGAIDRLLSAATDEEAASAYWELDKRVVVQGQLSEAAEPVAYELVRRVCAAEYSVPGLPRVLDLLVELAYGESDMTEVELGNADLGPRCRALVAVGCSASRH